MKLTGSLHITCTLLLLTLLACSCAGLTAPVTPDIESPDTRLDKSPDGTHHTKLLGYYVIQIDVETLTVTATPSRHALFTVNVVNFINSDPAFLKFQINDVIYGPDYIDIDIDVGIMHPFPGMNQYDGYDVRGIFMGDGTGSLNYISLQFPVTDVDQSMPADPVDDLGGPDGYTRWFNISEFSEGGLPLFSYTQGKLATPDYEGSATLCPYKYFADGLDADEDLWEFLNSTGDDGIFSAGSVNWRNYYIRFPNTLGVLYNYAITANWEAVDVHPSNAPEAVSCLASITDDIYFVSGSDNGGDLKADISIFSWNDQPSQIILESSVLLAPHVLTADEMDPVGGNENYSTYHVDIPADDIQSSGAHELWVIAEQDGYTYGNDFGNPNAAENDILASYFRFDFIVADENYNSGPIILSGVDGEEFPEEGSTETYSVEAMDPDSDPLSYNWTVYDDAGVPVPGYENIPGDNSGNLDIDWLAVAGYIHIPLAFDIACTVDDGEFFVDAETLSVEVTVLGDLYVSNHPDFASTPENGTMAEPYHTIQNAINNASSNSVILVDYGTGVYFERIYVVLDTRELTFRALSWYSDPGGRPEIRHTADNLPTFELHRSDGVTVQGFKFSFNVSQAQQSLNHAYDSDNCTFRDNCYTGRSGNIYIYAIHTKLCGGVTIENNLVRDVSGNAPVRRICGVFTDQGSTALTIAKNEVSGLQSHDHGPASAETLYIYGLRLSFFPAGSSASNNLIHHMEPNTPSSQRGFVLGLAAGGGYPSGDCYFSHNTIDTIDISAMQNYVLSRIRGISLDDAGGVLGDNLHSCIVSNITGANNQVTYGVYNWIQSDYMDVWAVDDYLYWQSSTIGPNSISEDPQFENNITPPYDYTLTANSPCKGTGMDGEDMGCYGNLVAGEVVGLLTPE